jgi:hypothetical protein
MQTATQLGLVMQRFTHLGVEMQRVTNLGVVMETGTHLGVVMQERGKVRPLLFWRRSRQQSQVRLEGRTAGHGQELDAAVREGPPPVSPPRCAPAAQGRQRRRQTGIRSRAREQLHGIDNIMLLCCYS